MSSIYGINSSYNYSAIASGKKIQSASNDAAGLAISQQLTAQINGIDKGTNNALDAQNLLNIADGALSSVSDSLQRIRELGIQASNPFYTDSDRRSIQLEIDELKGAISDAAESSNYNGKKLLDGSASDLYFATSADGSGKEVSIGSSLLDDLGIADFDVTKSFDISDIDKALDKVVDNRSNIGASYNALDYTISSNRNTSVNMQAANSRISDTDIASAVSELKKGELLDQYRIHMQKSNEGRQMAYVTKLLGTI